MHTIIFCTAFPHCQSSLLTSHYEGQKFTVEENIQTYVIWGHQVFEMEPNVECELIFCISFVYYSITTHSGHNVLRNGVNGQLLCRPQDQRFTILIIFQTFVPGGTVRQFFYDAQSQLGHLACRIEHYVLFWMVSVLDIELKQEAAINTCCYQHILILKEVNILNKANFERQLSDQNEVFVENMDVEVSRDHKIQLQKSVTNVKQYLPNVSWNRPWQKLHEILSLQKTGNHIVIHQ